MCGTSTRGPSTLPCFTIDVFVCSSFPTYGRQEGAAGDELGHFVGMSYYYTADNHDGHGYLVKKGDNIRLDAYHWVGTEDPRIATRAWQMRRSQPRFGPCSVSELSETIASVTLAMRMVVCCVPTNSTMSLRQETVALRISAMRARTCCPLDTLRPHMGHHTFQQNLSATVLEDFFCVL